MPTKRICLLSRSIIPDDPRVRRQGEAFFAAGWDVKAIGLPGAKSPIPAWMRGEAQGDASYNRGGVHQILRRMRLFPQFVLANASATLARRAVWSIPGVQDIYSRARRAKADIWLANDWDMLPVAARLADEFGGKIVYDSHEFATGQHVQSARWKYLFRPIACKVEKTFITRAEFVSTVSGGIGDALVELYGIAQPLVIRNTPVYQSFEFHETMAPVRVLYHGIVTPMRRMEETIDSVSMWKPEFELTIRGPGHPDYISALRERIASAGLSKRITIEPPVPMTELIAEANKFDVGIFAFGGASAQNKYVLPNKFFEYLMAGLSVCVSDLPEMARLVKDYDVGELINGYSPDEIAGAVNRLSISAIDRHKKNALALARDLSWENESRRLIERCEALVAGEARA